MSPGLFPNSGCHCAKQLCLKANRAVSRSRHIHYDGRSRLSNFWTPTGGISKKAAEGEQEDANDLLVRSGFLRQAYSGVFHLLPLGLRVQEKLERLIDKHMHSIGASKVSLSSLSSQELWERSGRLKEGSDVFKFHDRKEARFLLAPTHEEEITTLVGSLVKSHRDLPLRLYQISRKYRDEPRPRQGLLRGREFIMKDLYTFDYNVEDALRTYEAVKNVYTRLFRELKIPFLVAAADSGDMGGNLSHEFHFPSCKGEDTVVTCSSCDYVYNEELAEGKSYQIRPQPHPATEAFGTNDLWGAPAVSTGLWLSISRDKRTLVRCWYPQFLMPESGSGEPIRRQVNSRAVKHIAMAASLDLDPGVENPLEQWAGQLKSAANADSRSAAAAASSQRFHVLDLYDFRVRAYERPPLSELLRDGNEQLSAADVEHSMIDRFPGTQNGLDLLMAYDGDPCPRCLRGSVQTHSAVELGHTFHLGTRYSEVLQASVMIDQHASSPIQMGCHGIGVSRMIAAVADQLADSKGLNWPRAMAPYEVVVIPANGLEADAETVYDTLNSGGNLRLDVVLDDRNKPMGWKLGDADLIGYPVIVVVGKGWKTRRTLEVQCRRLNQRQPDVGLDQLPGLVHSLLERL